MSYYGDVYETIIDGASGLSPSGAPVGIITGTCSIGEVGKKYLIGNSSDIAGVLGSGRLVERIRDFFTKAPADAVLVAIPSAKDIAGESGTIEKTGSGLATVAKTGNPQYDGNIVFEILSDGGLNEATGKYSTDGGDTFSAPFTLPVGGVVAIGDTGMTFTFTESGLTTASFKKGDMYKLKITSPKSSLTAVMDALGLGLESYTPRFVYVAQGVDNVYRMAIGVKMDQLFEAHRPTYAITEAVEKSEIEDVDGYVNRLVTDRAAFSHRWVVCVGGYGEIVEATGKVPTRNYGGVLAGVVAKARVNQSVGEVSAFPVSNVILPLGWTEAHSKTLDESGYVTLRRYAGLNALFFANGRTMADAISDYQFIEVVDTTFKAIRLSRIAALKNLQSAGDKLGIKKVTADIESALGVMTSAFPKELDSYKVNIPEGQDVVNNGLAYELELFGIPILRKIKLFFMFKYANPFK